MGEVCYLYGNGAVRIHEPIEGAAHDDAQWRRDPLFYSS